MLRPLLQLRPLLLSPHATFPPPRGAVDLHCGQIQGFFGPRVPVDNLEAASVGVKYFVGKGLVNPVVVSPDAGGVYRAKQFREGLNLQVRWGRVAACCCCSHHHPAARCCPVRRASSTRRSP